MHSIPKSLVLSASAAVAALVAPPAALGTFAKHEITIDELQNLMAGGKELQTLSAKLGGTV